MSQQTTEEIYKPRRTRLQEAMARLVPQAITPNMITAFRLACTLAISLVALCDLALWWVLVLGFVAGMSDYLDGAVARHRGQTTKLGAFLDPLGDKLLALVVGYVLWHKGLLPWQPLVAALATEAHAVVLPVLTLARRAAARLPLLPLPQVTPNLWGKWKTGVLAWSMGFVLMGNVFGVTYLDYLGQVGVWLAVLYGAVAMVLYFRDWARGQWA